MRKSSAASAPDLFRDGDDSGYAFFFELDAILVDFCVLEHPNYPA
jgi:hypothetical protein